MIGLIHLESLYFPLPVIVLGWARDFVLTSATSRSVTGLLWLKQELGGARGKEAQTMPSGHKLNHRELGR